MNGAALIYSYSLVFHCGMCYNELIGHPNADAAASGKEEH